MLPREFDGVRTGDARRKKGGERRSITVPAVVAPAADPRHTAVAVLPPAALSDAGLTPWVRGCCWARRIGPRPRRRPAWDATC
jgi:hypothetical protein